MSEPPVPVNIPTTKDGWRQEAIRLGVQVQRLTEERGTLRPEAENVVAWWESGTQGALDRAIEGLRAALEAHLEETDE